MKVELEAVRTQLKQKVDANPEESQLLSTLGTEEGGQSCSRVRLEPTMRGSGLVLLFVW
jgi:hypothetical protein